MTSYLASVQAQQGSENKIEKKIIVTKMSDSENYF